MKAIRTDNAWHFKFEREDFYIYLKDKLKVMENKKKLGLEPAFPTPDYVLQNSGVIYDPVGMSKRFYAACMAMQGIISTLKGTEETIYYNQIAKDSYLMADELLKEENDE
jgi:hypothetical protein